MDVRRLIVDLTSGRVPFKKIQEILRKLKLPTGNSIERIRKNLFEYFEKKPEDYEKLLKIYYDVISFDSKAIKYYKTNRPTIEKLLSFLASYQIEPSDFKDAWPCTIPISKSVVPTGPILTHIEDDGDLINIYFCSIRVVKERVSLNPKDYSRVKTIKEYGFDELIGIRYIKRQFIDIITINKNANLIECKIDNSLKLAVNDIEFNFTALCQCFSRITQGTGINYLFRQAVNVHSALRGIYKNKNEGRISEARFITNTGSNKQETMKLKGDDLRDEKYHKAGMSALNNHVNFYWLSTRWGDNTSQKELIIPGHVRILLSPNPINDEIHISGCYNYDDYLFIFNRIKSFFN